MAPPKVANSTRPSKSVVFKSNGKKPANTQHGRAKPSTKAAHLSSLSFSPNSKQKGRSSPPPRSSRPFPPRQVVNHSPYFSCITEDDLGPTWFSYFRQIHHLSVKISQSNRRLEDVASRCPGQDPSSLILSNTGRLPSPPQFADPVLAARVAEATNKMERDLQFLWWQAQVEDLRYKIDHLTLMKQQVLAEAEAAYNQRRSSLASSLNIPESDVSNLPRKLVPDLVDISHFRAALLFDQEEIDKNDEQIRRTQVVKHAKAASTPQVDSSNTPMLIDEGPPPESSVSLPRLTNKGKSHASAESVLNTTGSSTSNLPKPLGPGKVHPKN